MTRLNKVGIMFRFITPILVTIAIFILTTVLHNQEKLYCNLELIKKEMSVYFSNHLTEHKDFLIQIEHRLTKIEQKLGG